MRTHLRSRPARWPAAVLAAALLAGCSSGGDDTGAEEANLTGATPTDDVPLDGADTDATPMPDVPGVTGAEPTDDVPGVTGAEPADDVATSQGQVPPLLDVVDGWPETTVTLDGDTQVLAKVADDAAERQQGLMNVPDLPAGVGMLFLFEEPREGGFWMKDTLVPLDIAYVDGDEVVAVLQMEPCEEDPCPSYDPGVAYDAALEVNQGELAAAGVDVGSTITWTDPVEVTAG